MTRSLLEQNPGKIYICSGASSWCHVSSTQSVNRGPKALENGSLLSLESARERLGSEVIMEQKTNCNTLPSTKRNHSKLVRPRGHLNCHKLLLHPNHYTLNTCEFFFMVYSFLFHKTPKENMKRQERRNRLRK